MEFPMPGWIILVVLLQFCFGGRKIPELMRRTGLGVAEFRKGCPVHTLKTDYASLSASRLDTEKRLRKT